MIDYAYALRVLLDYYKVEKRIKFKLIKELFLSTNLALIDNNFNITY
jgi:hypothetical protein